MIIYVKNQNILNTDCTGIVNFINVNGIIEKSNNSQSMMKNRFPNNHKLYQKQKEDLKLKIGYIFTCTDRNILTNQEKIIFNFPYKHDHTNSSQVDYISKGLKYFDYLMSVYSDEILPNVAIPNLKNEFNLDDYAQIKKLFNLHLGESTKVFVIYGM